MLPKIKQAVAVAIRGKSGHRPASSTP